MGGTYEYAALSIDPAELARLADGIAGSESILDRSTHIRAPSPVAGLAAANLARLTRTAFTAATCHDSARVEMMKRAFLYPYLLVAAHEKPDSNETAHAPKANIVRNAERWLDGAPPERLHVIDLCRALNLPLRTVQRAFRETVGMGPAHYLTFYRMHKVRRALMECDPTTSRVTDIALDQGFWELGRFAGLYRRVYGERPSETLRRRM
jgi:AraC family ethanolamine operon transcriptional activator